MIITVAPANEQVETLLCGARVHELPISEHVPVYDILRDCCGIEFLFDDEQVGAAFYPVPKLTIFARDNAGGWFAAAGQRCGMSMERNPVYHINKSRVCKHVADSMRALITAAAYDPTFIRAALGIECERAITEPERQYLIKEFELNIADAAPLCEVQEVNEPKIYLCRELAELDVEVLSLPLGMGGPAIRL